MKLMNIKTLKIGDKMIKVFEDHAVALKAWAEILLASKEPMLLLTLDTHSDTRDPFAAFACRRCEITNFSERSDITEEKLMNCDVRRPDSLDIHLNDLKNDEQIAAAISLKLFDAAFVLSSAEKNGTQPDFDDGELNEPRRDIYSVPYEKIFYLPNRCVPGCDKRYHNDDICERAHADCAIEAVHLSECLSHTEGMLIALNRESDLLQSNYILDIDLDYFRTELSLKPSDVEYFNRLVRSARAITIATEPSYVESERLDESVTAELSLEILLEHISKALEGSAR